MKLNLKLAWFITFLSTCANTFALTLHDKNAMQKINTSFSQLCQTNQFSGIVLIAIDGKIQFENLVA